MECVYCKTTSAFKYTKLRDRLIDYNGLKKIKVDKYKCNMCSESPVTCGKFCGSCIHWCLEEIILMPIQDYNKGLGYCILNPPNVYHPYAKSSIYPVTYQGHTCTFWKGEINPNRWDREAVMGMIRLEYSQEH